MEDDALYMQAMKHIDELVDDVFERCEEVADSNMYERDWVLEKFRDKFNQARRSPNITR